MGCRHSRMKLATLRPEERPATELEAHLEACALCRRLLEDDRKVWRMLELYEAPAPSVALLAEIEQMLAARAKGRARWRLAEAFANLRPALRFAAAALLAVVLGTGMGVWVGARITASGRVASSRAAAGTAQGYTQFFDVAPPGSMTRAYLSLDLGENSR